MSAAISSSPHSSAERGRRRRRCPNLVGGWWLVVTNHCPGVEVTRSAHSTCDRFGRFVAGAGRDPLGAISKSHSDFQLHVDFALRAQGDIEMVKERFASLSARSFADV